MTKQPLFTPCDLLNFKTHFTHLLDENRQKIQALTEQNEYTFENLIHPIDELNNQLHLEWSVLSHMHNVVDTDEMRTLYNDLLPVLSDYQTDIGHNRALYNAFQQIAKSAGFSQLSAEKQKMISNSLRDFRLSGIELSDENKALFREYEKKLSELSSRFGENVMDATYAWEKTFRIKHC